jgi:hypothetical protein
MDLLQKINCKSQKPLTVISRCCNLFPLLCQTAVNALLLWALCSNTFSLNEAAQASLKAKFKPSPHSTTASKIKTSPSAAVSAASSGGGGNFLLNKMVASGGGLAACAPPTGGRNAQQQQQQLTAAALCAPKAESEPVANDLRGE